MSTNNHFLSRQDLIKLVIDTHDELPMGKRTAYNLGVEIGKVKGKEFRRLVQGARTLVSSYISDLLVEILHPLILEGGELYPDYRKRCLEEFLSGLVRSTT